MATNAPPGISNETSRSTAKGAVPLRYSFVSVRATSIGLFGRAMRGWILAASTLLVACGGSETKADATAQVPVESTTVTPTAATDERVRVLFVGTSLTAGLGIDPEYAYPAVIQQFADSNGLRVHIVNAGLSGETSAGALRRVDWLLRDRPDVVVIETGANDGLRGLLPDTTSANIVGIIKKVRAVNPEARILLAQMEAPPNLGNDYTRRFRDLFLSVAAEQAVTLIPFFLDGVAGVPALNQQDGIHPTEAGARIAARNVWLTLSPVLRNVPGAVVR
jgi:acyl-CoA thioesterase-1